MVVVVVVVVVTKPRKKSSIIGIGIKSRPASTAKALNAGEPLEPPCQGRWDVREDIGLDNLTPGPVQGSNNNKNAEADNFIALLSSPALALRFYHEAPTVLGPSTTGRKRANDDVLALEDPGHAVLSSPHPRGNGTICPRGCPR